MISSASTLLLATLVFNAATVYGAPISIVDSSSEPVARAEISTPVQPVVARAIVDMQDNRRRSQLGYITRRMARLSERDEPLPEAVVAREPEPVVESREHRYPRRVYHDFYVKREPEPEPVVPVVVPVVESREHRYPRRVYHDFYEKREPATTITETTKEVKKVTVLDTPADVAAFVAANGANSASASLSSSGVTVSTITSTSQTTTIAASGSAPTPAPTDSSSASASSSADATSSASASDSASTSASATSTADAGEPTPTSSATSSAASDEPTPTASGDSTEATPTASATSSAASGQPTGAPADGASDDAKSGVTSDGVTDSPNPSAREDTGGDIAEARRGIYIKASTAPIVRRLATSGASWASAVRRQLNTH